MAWLEVHQSLREHRKLYSCADDLEIEPVLLLGMLVSLWLWALDNTPDGGLDGITNRTIARATRWPEKKADQLVTALINNGWIDRTEEGGLALHDWNEYGGKLTERRSADRARKQRKSAERRWNSAGIPAEKDGNRSGNPSLHYTTLQNTTEQNTTEHQPPVSPDGATGGETCGPDGPAAPSVDYKAIQAMYNATCPSLPKCKVLSDARKSAIRARIRGGYTLDDFQALFAKAEASAFLRGANKRNWVADFDWLTGDANMAKVLDGKYDNRPKEGANGNDAGRDEKAAPEYGICL